MAPTALHPENPYIKVNEQAIVINYKGQNHNLLIETIANVYLKKNKGTQIPTFMKNLLPFYEKKFKLYLRTHDGNEIKVKVNAEERHYFINLVNHIRKTKSVIAMNVA